MTSPTRVRTQQQQLVFFSQLICDRPTIGLNASVHQTGSTHFSISVSILHLNKPRRRENQLVAVAAVKHLAYQSK